MHWLILIAMIAWFILGDPGDTVADLLWSYSAAPWEDVAAIYYPDSRDLTRYLEVTGLESVQECRDEVFAMAAENDDPALARGDYECGVGCDGSFGELSVCRITVQ